jgi:hypothetical protein
VKVDALIVAGLIASLKVALSTWPTATFVAPFAGTVDITVGGRVVVVNVQTYLDVRGVPPGSVAPVVIVPVYVVP